MPLAILLLCAFIFLSLPLRSQAQTSSAVTLGLQWLSSQVQSDGSLSNEAQSIATPLQNRAEVAQTLTLLATLPPTLASNINSIGENNTQYLSRQIIALSASRIDTSSYVGLLTQRQNADGGFGGASAYASDIINTSWAILALAQANQTGSVAAANARKFLTTQIGIDGGIMDSTLWSRIYDTSMALQALLTTPDNSNAAFIADLSRWLSLQQNSDGSWQSANFLTATSLIALTPVSSDASANGTASNFLLSKQNADGSWNDDPFLTAVILRALSGQSGSSTNTTLLQGQVVDSASNTPLAGATVSVIGSSISTTTGASGNFTLSRIAAGTYSLGISNTGYNATTHSATVVAGQTTNVGTIALAQLGTSTIVNGQIIAAGSGAPLSGVTITISGATTASATTDANGHYTITGATSGAITITASLAGYQTATGTGTLTVGQTMNFAPSLYPTGQTAPSGIQYSGTVVSAGTSTPLSGVTVQITGSANSSTVTAAAGQFSVTLNPGTYNVTFSLAGYASVTQHIIAVASTSINAGSIGLKPIVTSSTISGQVVNGSNQPIAGATVQAVGTTNIVTTAADGTYTLSNVSGTTISVRAGATGFNSQTASLQASQSGNLIQNFTLAAQTAGTLSIGNLSVTPASVGSNANVTVATVITNSGAASSSAVIQLQILDPTGKLIGAGLAYDTNNNLVGQITVTTGQPMPVNLIWNSGQFPAGTYSLQVRLVQVGSLTQTTPQGTQLAVSATSVTVTAQPHFTGSVTANPPVLQAGTNTPVQLSATIRNNGNIPLAAQSFTLSVINTATNAVVQTLSTNSAAAAVNGIQTLLFPTWIPTTSGNFSLVVAAVAPALGSVTGTLYIGDAGSATYTTNKLVVPTGTQTVRGTVNVLGQNVATGTISDPLAPLIKTAVQNAVPYGYATAANDTIASQCTRCHIQSQAIVGGELTKNITNYASFIPQRDIIFNALTTTQQSNGSLDGYSQAGPYASEESMLAMWALNTWHNPSEITSILAKGARYIASDQNADGTWSFADSSNRGWWDVIFCMTASNVKNLVNTSNILSQLPAGSAFDYSATILTSQGINQPYGLATDPSGNTYVLNYGGGTVSLVNPDGSTQSYISGLVNPTAMIFASDGTAYVSSYGGLYHRNADGSLTQVASGSGTGLAMGPDGNIYVSSYWNNKIYMVTPAGVVSDYIVGGALKNPWGIAFSSAGDLLVANYGGENILRYHADLTQDVVVGWTYYHPYNLQATANGYMVTTDTGLFSYNSNWHGERQLFTNMSGLTITSDGTVLVGDMNANTVSKLTSTPINTTALLASMSTSIGSGTAWLLQDSNVDSTNNIQLAQRLMALGAANTYYQGQPLAQTIQAKMQEVNAQLRAHVNADGGWSFNNKFTTSDSLVTAQVGMALDTLNPSASDPIIRNAVTWILGRQQADGTWISENNVMTTPLATTTWVVIWLPIALDRLGGINTNLSVTFPANVKMSNPDSVPTSITANSDGSSTALWALTGVTASGQTVNYDLTLQNMLPGEVRSVSTDAHLTFNNTFTNTPVNASIAIPQVTASAFLSLGVTTDKQTYTTNNLVNITGQVTNTSVNLSSGSVGFSIYAPDNTLIANIGSMPFNNLAAAASTNLGMTWNTGSTLANTGYYILATLSDVNGNIVGTAKTTFDITANTGNSTTVKISSNKQTYQPTDTVNLTDTINNVAANTILNNATVVTTVTGPTGTTVFTQTATLAQLAPANSKTYNYSIPLSTAAAGSYTANVVVSSGGSTVASASTSFTVASSATTGNGLSGSVSIANTQIQIGSPVAITYSALNSGNSILSGLPLTLTIIDPVAQKVLASYPTTQTLAIGASYAGANNWTSSGTVGNTYVAVLTATLSGNTITLGQANFTLTAAQTKLAITQALWNSNRVLVFTACTDAGNGPSAQAANCTATRYLAIDKALTGLGLQHVITTNTTAFTHDLRSGLYDTIWIADEQSLLGNALTAEISEVVNGGASLIVDGIDNQCDVNFDLLGGIQSRNNLAPNLGVTLNGSFYTSTGTGTSTSTSTLPTVGNGQSFTLSATGNGQIQGVLIANNGGPTKGAPVLVSNKVGAGRTLIAGFDLGATLVTQASAWNASLAATFNAITPTATASLTPGQVLPLQTDISNQANPVALDIKTTLPATASYLSASPSATYSTNTNTIDWSSNLAIAQSAAFYLTSRAPTSTGNYNLPTIVSTVNNSTDTAYGNPLSFPISVTAGATTAANVVTALQALTLNAKQDQTLRTTAIASLNQAMSNFKLNTYAGYGTAISQLIALADSLSGFSAAANSSNAINAIHAQIDQILQEAQWRWTLLQPEVSATLSINKTNCQPTDTVTVSDKITNITSTTTLNNLSVLTTVTSASGIVILSKTETPAALGVGDIQQYSYGIALNTTPAIAPGTYTASMTVTDANGNLLAQSSSQFSVASTATTGAGLGATIQVTPQQIPQGSTATISIAVTNQGNSAVSNLPLTLTIINSATQQVLSQTPYTGSVNIGGTYNASGSWTASAAIGNNYQASLSAQLGSLKLPLAQANFSIVAQPIQLSITQQLAPWQNLLVYSACKRPSDGYLGQCGATPVPADDPVTLASCDTALAGNIDQALTNLAISHNVSSNASDFLGKLRSGLYNSYWISTGATVLAEPDASELHAAVLRGSGLLIDGLDGGSTPQLQNCAGVSYKAASNNSSQTLSFNGALFSAASLTVATPIELGATSGTEQASYGSIANGGVPGIINSNTGNGKTLAFAFDWIGSILAQTNGNNKINAAWTSLTEQSLNYLTPAIVSGTQFVAGDTITLNIGIQNTGQPANLQVVQTLPAGASVIATTPMAQINGNTVTWTDALPQHGDQIFSLRLQLPHTAGSYSIGTAVNTVGSNGKPVLYQAESYSFSTQNAQQLLNQLTSAVQAQKLNTAQAQATGAAIIAQLNQAQTALLAGNSNDEILRLLLSAQVRIARIDTGTLTPILVNLIAAVEHQATP